MVANTINFIISYIYIHNIEAAGYIKMHNLQHTQVNTDRIQKALPRGKDKEVIKLPVFFFFSFLT